MQRTLSRGRSPVGPTAGSREPPWSYSCCKEEGSCAEEFDRCDKQAEQEGPKAEAAPAETSRVAGGERSLSSNPCGRVPERRPRFTEVIVRMFTVGIIFDPAQAEVQTCGPCCPKLRQLPSNLHIVSLCALTVTVRTRDITERTAGRNCRTLPAKFHRV